MKKVALAALVGFLFVGCTNKDSAAVTTCKSNCLQKLQDCASSKGTQEACEYAYKQCLTYCQD